MIINVELMLCQWKKAAIRNVYGKIKPPFLIQTKNKMKRFLSRNNFSNTFNFFLIYFGIFFCSAEMIVTSEFNKWKNSSIFFCTDLLKLIHRNANLRAKKVNGWIFLNSFFGNKLRGYEASGSLRSRKMDCREKKDDLLNKI